MSRSTLDFLAVVADLYSPILLVLCLAVCIYQWRNGHKLYWLRLLAIAVVCYAVMFIDLGFALWSRLGLDFSTHTATSLGMVLFLAAAGSKNITYGLGVSLIAYFYLMYIHGYHSWADMVSTAVVMSLLVWPVFKATAKFAQQKPN